MRPEGFGLEAQEVSREVIREGVAQANSREHQTIIAMARNAERRRLESANNIPFVVMAMLILTLFSFIFYQCIVRDGNGTPFV